MSKLLNPARLILLVPFMAAGCSEVDPSSRATVAYSVADVPLSDISDDLAAGRTTSVEVTQAYIERIQTMDGPLNSVILVAPDALEQAVALRPNHVDSRVNLGAVTIELLIGADPGNLMSRPRR